MNDDEPSSSSAPYATPSHDAAYDRATTAASASTAEKIRFNRRMFNKKRAELLDDLLRNLDMLVYAELSTIYYLDCSFLRFALRAFVQFVFLTPKPPMFPEHSLDSPVLGAFLGSNILCFLLHVFLAQPSASEATRGYLHGGLAMDFIGQQGPSSKVLLVFLDFVVLLLQLVHLAAGMTRRRLSEKPAAADSVQSAPAVPAASQDLDSEERGVRRSDEQQDVEMQVLNAAGARSDVHTDHADVESNSERESLLANTSPRTDTHIFDAFHSGQIVLADLNVVRSAREQLQLSRAGETGSTGPQRNIRAELAQRILRMRIGADRLRGGF